MEKIIEVYKNKETKELVGQELELEMFTPEDDSQGESLSEEYDIKDGFQLGYGHQSEPYINTPLLFEVSGGNHESGLSHFGENMSVPTNFTTLALNHLRTLSSQRGTTRVRQYTLTGGVVTDVKRTSGLDLNLSHFTLGRQGRRKEARSSYSILSNVWNGGNTCHGGLNDARMYAENKGLTTEEPEALMRSHLYFKNSRGNTDIIDDNVSRSMKPVVILNIVESYLTHYVPTIMNRSKRDYMERFLNGYKNQINGRDPDREMSIAMIPLGIILTEVPDYHIEDFI